MKAQAAVGYSGTPLPKKLGIKEQMNIALIGAPANMLKALQLPASTTQNQRKPLDFAMLFVKSQAELKKAFPDCAAKLAPAGMLWVAWPKESSGIAADLSENAVRAIGLANELVDVKVCAITEVWSGLKFVIRVKNRK